MDARNEDGPSWRNPDLVKEELEHDIQQQGILGASKSVNKIVYQEEASTTKMKRLHYATSDWWHAMASPKWCEI